MQNRLEENSRARSRVLLIVVAVTVSIVGLAFDRMLLREGIPRYDLLGISNSLTGIVAGAFYWQLLRRERERRDFLRERLFVISEMNHHIRNALQVISFYSYRKQDAETLAMLQQAVTRIEWALKEVLPGEHVEDLARAGLADELQVRRRG
jgi:two-component sensor histidine kinase